MTDEEKQAFRKELSDRFDQVWDTAEMRRDFQVLGFCAGLCCVTRMSDLKRGSLDFTHYPRFYHSFQEG